MQPIRQLLAALLLACALTPAAAQTIKTLGFNTTNGQVVYSGTNTLTFTNNVTFRQAGTDAFRSYSNVTEFYKPIWIGDSGTNDIFQFEIGETDQAKGRANFGFSTNLNTLWTATNVAGFYTSSLTAYSLIAAAIVEDPLTAREDLGLPLAALTNTSNVTMMRALSGTTNTNAPTTGVFYLTNILSITVSNGIIVDVEEP